jgi:hypothetical protein
MKNFDKLFEQEQVKIAAKNKIKKETLSTKAEILIDFCESSELFDFLDYLQSKFYISKHGVNYHVDGAVYTNDVVEGYERKNAVKYLKANAHLRLGINYRWTNGSVYDSIRLTCVDFKPNFEYEGKKVDVDSFKEIVVAQIQFAINKNSPSFEIRNK